MTAATRLTVSVTAFDVSMDAAPLSSPREAQSMSPKVESSRETNSGGILRASPREARGGSRKSYAAGDTVKSPMMSSDKQGKPRVKISMPELDLYDRDGASRESSCATLSPSQQQQEIPGAIRLGPIRKSTALISNEFSESDPRTNATIFALSVTASPRGGIFRTARSFSKTGSPIISNGEQGQFTTPDWDAQVFRLKRREVQAAIEALPRFAAAMRVAATNESVDALIEDEITTNLENEFYNTVVDALKYREVARNFIRWKTFAVAEKRRRELAEKRKSKRRVSTPSKFEQLMNRGPKVPTRPTRGESMEFIQKQISESMDSGMARDYSTTGTTMDGDDGESSMMGGKLSSIVHESVQENGRESAHNSGGSTSENSDPIPQLEIAIALAAVATTITAERSKIKKGGFLSIFTKSFRS